MNIPLTIERVNLLTANERRHRMDAARATKVLRHAAAINAQAVGGGPFNVAHVTVWISYPDRRRRDRLNLAPTVKAIIDGFTDAGLWPDDDDTHLIGPDFRTTSELAGLGRGVTRLEFVIEEVGA